MTWKSFLKVPFKGQHTQGDYSLQLVPATSPLKSLHKRDLSQKAKLV